MVAFLLSLGVRFFKYGGLYLLFRGVTQIHLPQMATAGARHVLPALLAGEGAAALPLPALMGFGAYEGGSTAVWIMLGFAPDAALLAMLALHIVSQAADYTLGGIAFILITMSHRAARTEKAEQVRAPRYRWVMAVVILVLFGTSLLYLGIQWRGLRKRGSLTPPAQGAAWRYRNRTGRPRWLRETLPRSCGLELEPQRQPRYHADGTALRQSPSGHPQPAYRDLSAALARWPAGALRPLADSLGLAA